ncbi:glycosyltransferase family 2 protein [Shewanella phaeophyticola]|uniref:Glycosyltransferase family 2 protein n=1 Tax=Shewanella phaeophyticola TaxID=2978345 RepID=A0ABT2P3S7_9GAMM|nr:glycosyltransferase family 2 protein [Shewanella sp. KJ10-1]MCT8987051.1 glycosyltransferase family 2 protein [Shewanella sp. KJ10-1]
MFIDDNTLSEGLTVVIPTYGRTEKILNSIHSCLHPKIFIIVIDDNGLNSPNQQATKKLIDSLSPKYTTNLVYYALDVNSGACIARNKGIELASTSVVTFLDDDDILLVEETLQKLEFFGQQVDSEICCSDMLSRFNGKEYQLPFCFFRGLTPISLLEDGNCYTPMIMAKKDLLKRIGGFDNCKKYQDHVLMLKIHLNNVKVCFYENATFVHVDHDEFRISNNPCSYQTVKMRFKYEFDLLEKIDLNVNKYNELKKIIVNRKRYLCFYFIMLPRFNGFKKCFLGTKRFLMSYDNSNSNSKSKIYINYTSLLYALKTINGLPFIIKRSAYMLKGKNK